MATKFKKLSEVTLLDSVTDNAAVLVEEDGEIKRVPKAKVGGASGYVMTLTDDNTSYVDYSNVCDENYDDMYNVIMAGGTVWIHDTRDGYYYLVGACCPTSSGLMVSAWEYNVIFPNGSYNLEENPK